MGSSVHRRTANSVRTKRRSGNCGNVARVGDQRREVRCFVHAQRPSLPGMVASGRRSIVSTLDRDGRSSRAGTYAKGSWWPYHRTNDRPAIRESSLGLAQRRTCLRNCTPSVVIAHPEAKPTCGASVRTNNRRHDDFGRPLRRYATMAAPTSGGIGICARCRPLARTRYLAGAPADIIERERRDLVGPQAQLGQQQQNGVVAPPHHRLSVATVDSRPHLSGRQIGRQSCELPSSHRWNAIRQRARVQPPMVEVTRKARNDQHIALPVFGLQSWAWRST